ncbi:MAG: F0F1 ATP synthase subunit A [Gemmatimonadota bacterium]
MTRARLAFALLTLMALGARPALAQEFAEHAASAGFSIGCPPHSETKPGPADIIMPHLVDSKHLEVPWPCSMEHWGAELTLPTWNVHIGGMTIDVAPTKHVVFLLIAATLTALMLVLVARAHERSTKAIGHPKGFAAAIEGVILYLRNEIYMPVIGHGGEKYVPFCLTLFFFIYFCNVLGLLPYGSTATGNIAVTAGLALITFFVVEIAGIRTLGKAYIGTIIYWPHDMPLALKAPLTLVMTPVELIGKFTKPFALTIRLFANMVAGHVVILVLIGLIFLFGFGAAIGSVPMALFIMILELLVTLIQAFIFSLLAAVFIGQIRTSHH